MLIETVNKGKHNFMIAHIQSALNFMNFAIYKSLSI